LAGRYGGRLEVLEFASLVLVALPERNRNEDQKSSNYGWCNQENGFLPPRTHFSDGTNPPFLKMLKADSKHAGENLLPYTPVNL
jgi:hypothetical protein